MAGGVGQCRSRISRSFPELDSSCTSESEEDDLLECESVLITSSIAISTSLMTLITNEMLLWTEQLSSADPRASEPVRRRKKFKSARERNERRQANAVQHSIVEHKFVFEKSELTLTRNASSMPRHLRVIPPKQRKETRFEGVDGTRPDAVISSRPIHRPRIRPATFVPLPIASHNSMDSAAAKRIFHLPSDRVHFVTDASSRLLPNDIATTSVRSLEVHSYRMVTDDLLTGWATVDSMQMKQPALSLARELVAMQTVILPTQEQHVALLEVTSLPNVTISQTAKRLGVPNSNNVCITVISSQYACKARSTVIVNETLDVPVNQSTSGLKKKKNKVNVLPAPSVRDDALEQETAPRLPSESVDDVTVAAMEPVSAPEITIANAATDAIKVVAQEDSVDQGRDANDVCAQMASDEQSAHSLKANVREHVTGTSVSPEIQLQPPSEAKSHNNEQEVVSMTSKSEQVTQNVENKTLSPEISPKNSPKTEAEDAGAGEAAALRTKSCEISNSKSTTASAIMTEQSSNSDADPVNDVPAVKNRRKAKKVDVAQECSAETVIAAVEQASDHRREVEAGAVGDGGEKRVSNVEPSAENQAQAELSEGDEYLAIGETVSFFVKKAACQESEKLSESAAFTVIKETDSVGHEPADKVLEAAMELVNSAETAAPEIKTKTSAQDANLTSCLEEPAAGVITKQLQDGDEFPVSRSQLESKLEIEKAEQEANKINKTKKVKVKKVKSRAPSAIINPEVGPVTQSDDLVTDTAGKDAVANQLREKSDVTETSELSAGSAILPELNSESQLQDTEAPDVEQSEKNSEEVGYKNAISPEKIIESVMKESVVPEVTPKKNEHRRSRVGTAAAQIVYEESETPSTTITLVQEPESVFKSQAVGEEYDMKRGSSKRNDDRSSTVESPQKEVQVVGEENYALIAEEGRENDETTPSVIGTDTDLHLQQAVKPEGQTGVRRYSKTEESLAFAVRRPSQLQAEDVNVIPSASLTIHPCISQAADESAEQEDVQLSHSIRAKNKTRKTKQKSAAAQRDEEEQVSDDRRYSKTEESVDFSIRRPSQPQTTDISGSTSASLTIGKSADADDAISKDEGDVQVSMGIKKKRKSIKGQQMVATSIEAEEELGERRYSKTEESVALSIRRPSPSEISDISDSPSASLTIVSDAAINLGGSKEVQVALEIKKKRQSNKGKQMVVSETDEELVQCRYSKTEELVAFSIKQSHQTQSEEHAESTISSRDDAAVNEEEDEQIDMKTMSKTNKVEHTLVRPAVREDYGSHSTSFKYPIASAFKDRQVSKFTFLIDRKRYNNVVTREDVSPVLSRFYERSSFKDHVRLNFPFASPSVSRNLWFSVDKHHSEFHRFQRKFVLQFDQRQTTGGTRCLLHELKTRVRQRRIELDDWRWRHVCQSDGFCAECRLSKRLLRPEFPASYK